MPSFPGASVVGRRCSSISPLLCGGEGRWTEDGQHETALLFNYVFVRSSVEGDLPDEAHASPIQFPSQVSSGGMTHFPYLSDDEMGNLR